MSHEHTFPPNTGYIFVEEQEHTNDPIRTLEQFPPALVRPPKLDPRIHIHKLRHLLQCVRDAVHLRSAYVC